ncbi:flagellar hook-associated protein FlgK [Miltoncostaea marina]|uniref:flagellar hook-associated protein FlgK n=1 Tax=Miltoncostaea marina TaxID=2843215 RepID=UPI001C3CACAC|nr:flagellar hook-associated protein FlgK [Miltoncostaea marina]
MASTFFGLNSAVSGILTAQRALNTVSHNLTNATTPGYSRQRVDTAAAPAYAHPGLTTAVGVGQLGTGVVATQYARLRDGFADLSHRAATSDVGQFEARGQALSTIDTVLDEPGETGISHLLSGYWGAWQTLSLQPDSAAAREAVRQAGDDLARGFNDLSRGLAASQAEASARIELGASRVNDLAGQVNELNKQIAMVVAVGQQPNDLRDQRDLLIDELASYANVTVSEAGAAGKVSIAIGSQLIVDSTTDTAGTLAIDAAGAATVNGAATTIASGNLRGLVDVRDAVIGGPDGYIAQLDTLAATVATAVNGRHEAGFGRDGGTGTPFFTGTTAATIGISAPVRASVDAIATSGSAADLPAGSDVAVGIAQLQFLVQTIGASTTTMDGFYAQFVSRVGLDTDQASRMAQVQKGVLAAAEARRSSVSGVNLDEEMTDMVRFQKSYNAAARMVTALDEMLETLVSGMGVVGR